MKQLVLDTALRLMQVNGHVSTLEVKNLIHTEKNDPSFVLTQKEVSNLMKQLASEENWQAVLNSTNPNARYFEYSLPFAAASGTTSTTSRPAQVSSVNNSNEPVTCYVATNPKLYATGSTRKEARNKAYNMYKTQVSGLSYDHINHCTTAYFLANKL